MMKTNKEDSSLLEFSATSTDNAVVLYDQNHILNKAEDKFLKTDKTTARRKSLKTIKIQVLVPKGFLKTLDMDSFKLGRSNTQLSIGCKANEKNSIKKATEKTRREILENRQPIVPIMGRTALLAKYKGWNKDAEIITNIVMDKFRKTLSRYKKRNTNKEIIVEKASNDKCCHNLELINTDLLMAKKTDDNEIMETDSLNQHDLLSKRNSNYSNGDIFDQSFNEDTDSDSQKESLISTEDLQEVNGKMEYSQEKFLEEALGDEISKYLMESQQKDSTSEASTSNLVLAEEDSSISTTQISYLVSKASSVYSLFSKKLRQQRNTHTSSPVLNETSDTEDHPADSKAAALMNEAAIQHQIIVQTCKALNICLNSKEFKSSREYVEAERILLLAILKRNAVKKELIRVDYDELEEKEFKYLGQVTVSNIVVPSQPEQNQSPDFIRWFLIIADCGSSVLASDVARADQNGDIRIKKTFIFENLDSDFQITVSIYSLYVRNGVRNMSHESKFHIKDEATTSCPSPNKIFHKSSSSHRRYYSYERRDPLFVFCGGTTVHIGDLCKPTQFKLNGVSDICILKGVINVALSGKVEIVGIYTGFLTVGAETGGCASWNRRWCYLKEYKLYYWNYPAEQEHCDPIGLIDLSYSVTSSVSQVDRELCARPRTLLLETGKLSSPQDTESMMVVNNVSYTITRHYLQADNYGEMVEWKNQLNSIIAALRNWNCMKCELHFYK